MWHCNSTSKLFSYYCYLVTLWQSPETLCRFMTDVSYLVLMMAWPFPVVQHIVLHQMYLHLNHIEWLDSVHFSWTFLPISWLKMINIWHCNFDISVSYLIGSHMKKLTITSALFGLVVIGEYWARSPIGRVDVWNLLLYHAPLCTV